MSAVKGVPERRITDLDILIRSLPSKERALGGRLFDVIRTTGRLEVPQAMRGWVEKTFGSVSAVRE